MIKIINILEGTLYCLIFTFSIKVIDTYIDQKKYKPQSITKTSQIKKKIFLILCMVTFLVMLTYVYKCQENENQQINFLQCIYINPGQQLVRNVAIALFVNTTLFLGGLHQQLYNGGIKKKFMRFYKKQFQWNLFKKLFIVPLSAQIVFRALLCRVVDPHLEHPSFFVLFSGTLYSFSHSINYFKFRQKYDYLFSLKATGIQLIYNFIFGLYLSHIFSRSSTLISSLICQVYGNFMGYPQYFQILKGDLYDDRVRKTALFYLFGVIGCLSCCLFL